MSRRLAAHPLRVALALLAGVACADPRGDVAAWLTCEECPTELARVVAHGDAALEPLVVALYRGAAWPHQQNFLAQVWEERRLAERAAALDTIFRGHGLSDSAVMLSRALRNLLSESQQRAAWAIRAIDTPAARAALHEAAGYGAAGALGWPSEVTALVLRLDAADPATSVSVRSPVRVLALGDSAQLAAEVHGPLRVRQDVIWSSSAAAAVTVTADGRITRVSRGTVTVRACSATAPTVCGSVSIGMP
ncbi:MAG: Ig-like domain-containing protein [Gemmatimonadaceae bacterium]